MRLLFVASFKTIEEQQPCSEERARETVTYYTYYVTVGFGGVTVVWRP